VGSSQFPKKLARLVLAVFSSKVGRDPEMFSSTISRNRAPIDTSPSSGKTFIVIDHNHAHLLELSDRLNVIQQGRVAMDLRVDRTSMAQLTELMVSEYRRQLTNGQTQLDD
jgi:ABC-type sugar transport system ATPase subunit